MRWLSQTGVRLAVAATGAAAGGGIGYLFYQHPVPAGVLAVAGLWAVPVFEKFRSARRDRALTGQFRQFLYALSTSLAAGRSVDNAMIAAEQDLAVLLATDKSAMVQALRTMNGKVANGVPPEKAFAEFGERTSIADIRHFADVLAISRHSGGDIVDLIRKTANLIAEKIEIEQEIHVMTAQKSFEAKALTVVPFAMIGFLALGSPEYMAPLYEGVGRAVMTAVLIALGFGILWMQAIMRIEV